MTLKTLAVSAAERLLPSTIVESLQARRWTNTWVPERDHEPELSLVRAYLQSGDIAIDVGAYGGAFSHAMATAIGSEGQVFSFEPLPRYARVLRLALKRVGIKNVEVVQQALMETRRSVQLAYATSSGRSLVGEVYVAEEPDGNRTTAVEANTLDDFARDRSISSSVSLIKIDIEGSELSLLKGAGESLAASKPVVICEVEERHCARFGHSARDVFDEFSRSGLLPFEFDLRTCTLEPWTGDGSTNNVIFVHETSVERVRARLAEHGC